MTPRMPGSIRAGKCAIHVTPRRFLLIALFCITFPSLLSAQGTQLDRDSLELQCVACHSGHREKPQYVFNPRTGIRANVMIDMPEFREADHGNMLCVDCHTLGFDQYPHGYPRQRLSCMACHPGPLEKTPEFVELGFRRIIEDAEYDFWRIEKEYENSLHFTEVVNFTCEECHDPHYFVATKDQPTPLAILENDNAPCIRCHKADALDQHLLSDPADPDLVALHEYVQLPREHVDNTRCIDCHTDIEHVVAHDMRKGEDADQGCMSCHSTGSIMMTRHYRYHDDLKGTDWGFHNAALMQEKYVMGANRNRYIDYISYGIIGVTLFVLGVYVIDRRIYKRRRRARQSKGDD